jgi:CBS domain containing-hemolysin-like protein
MSDPQRDDEFPPGNGKAGSLLHRLAHLVRRGHGANGIRESLEEVIEESDRQSTELSPQERRMLSNLLKFGEMRVGDVMVPRADIVAVEEQTPLKELIESLRREQHSRLPIYRETLDDPIGLVHVKDLLSLVEIGADGTMRWPDVPISKIRRNILFVPASMPALDLLLQMQTTHMHLALVIDEYGGTDGLVSIEDLVEEIVGDIDDEHDVAEAPQLKALPDGGWEADARIDLDDFREQTGLELGPEGEDEEVDTLGGLVVSLLGRLPQRGEIVPHPSGVEFEVLEADPRRVKRLRLRRSQTEAAAEPASES